MTESDLDRQLEELSKPAVLAPELGRQLKLTLVDAQASSYVGAFLIAIPSLFLFAVIAHYGFGMPFPGLDAVESLMVRLDSETSTLRFLSPLVLAGGPLLALALNLLAILHVAFDRRRRELLITVKLRVLNLIIAGASAAILGMLVAHIISERTHHLP